MSLGFGYNSWVGVGTEATYGTPVTRTNFLEINSESLTAEDDVVKSNSVYWLTDDVDNYCQGRKKIGGGIEFDVRVQGAESILKSAFGTHSYIANGTSVDGGTLHTFGIADAVGSPLTMEVNRDVASFVYHGCKINSLTLNGGNEGMLTASADIIGEDEGTTAVSTPSFSTSKYWCFSQCALTIDSGTRSVTGFNVTLNNNLTDDRYHLGSRFMKEPQRAGRVSVTGDITVEFDGTTDWSTFNSAGTAALVAKYTGDTLTGTIANYLQVTIPYMRFTGMPINVSDSGRIMYTIPFEGLSDGTGVDSRPLKIELSNLTNGTDVY